jgi:hypothetical protein
MTRRHDRLHTILASLVVPAGCSTLWVRCPLQDAIASASGWGGRGWRHGGQRSVWGGWNVFLFKRVFAGILSGHSVFDMKKFR